MAAWISAVVMQRAAPSDATGGAPAFEERDGAGAAGSGDAWSRLGLRVGVGVRVRVRVGLGVRGKGRGRVGDRGGSRLSLTGSGRRLGGSAESGEGQG